MEEFVLSVCGADWGKECWGRVLARVQENPHTNIYEYLAVLLNAHVCVLKQTSREMKRCRSTMDKLSDASKQLSLCYHDRTQNKSSREELTICKRRFSMALASFVPVYGRCFTSLSACASPSESVLERNSKVVKTFEKIQTRCSRGYMWRGGGKRDDEMGAPPTDDSVHQQWTAVSTLQDAKRAVNNLLDLLSAIEPGLDEGITIVDQWVLQCQQAADQMAHPECIVKDVQEGTMQSIKEEFEGAKTGGKNMSPKEQWATKAESFLVQWAGNGGSAVKICEHIARGVIQK
jgi:hypothetical protein